MRGFDYRLGKPVNRSLVDWRALAQEVVHKGGFLREDPKLGETFITSVVNRQPEIVAEIYAVNLPLRETK